MAAAAVAGSSSGCRRRRLPCGRRCRGSSCRWGSRAAARAAARRSGSSSTSRCSRGAAQEEGRQPGQARGVWHHPGPERRRGDRHRRLAVRRGGLPGGLAVLKGAQPAWCRPGPGMGCALLLAPAAQGACLTPSCPSLLRCPAATQAAVPRPALSHPSASCCACRSTLAWCRPRALQRARSRRRRWSPPPSRCSASRSMPGCSSPTAARPAPWRSPRSSCSRCSWWRPPSRASRSSPPPSLASSTVVRWGVQDGTHNHGLIVVSPGIS